MLSQFLDGYDVSKSHGSGAIDEAEGSMGVGEMLPDELEHEELVEVGVEQRPSDGIELPIVVVRAPGEIDNHGLINVKEVTDRLKGKRKFGEARGRGLKRSFNGGFGRKASLIWQGGHGAGLRGDPTAPAVPCLIEFGQAGTAQEVMGKRGRKCVARADGIGPIPVPQGARVGWRGRIAKCELGP